MGIGVRAGADVTGIDNTMIGASAGRLTLTGNQNTFIGRTAGRTYDNAYFNVIIGNQAGLLGTGGDNNIIIGHQAIAVTAAGSNQLNIGGLIFGDMGVTKRVGINNNAPGDTLDVTGGITLSGTFTHNGSSLGFYGIAPIAQPAGVAVTAAGIHAALVSLGLIT